MEKEGIKSDRNGLVEMNFYDSARKRGLGQEDIDEMAIPSYGHRNPLIRWVFRKRLRTLVGFVDFRGKTVLDFGCGTGILFGCFKKAKRIYACDLHPEIAKDTAKKIGLDVKFIKSINGLGNNSIDIAIFADVLEHVKDYRGLFRTLERKMKKNGEIIVSLPTETGFYRMCRKIAGYDSRAVYHQNSPRTIQAALDRSFSRNKIIKLPFLFPLFKLSRYTLKKNG